MTTMLLREPLAPVEDALSVDVEATPAPGAGVAPVRRTPRRRRPCRLRPTARVTRCAPVDWQGFLQPEREAVRPRPRRRPAARRHAAVRLTARGRALVRAVGLLVVAGATALLLLVVDVPGGGTAPSEQRLVAVVVEPGDSLWSIATRVAPGEDPRSVINAIEDANTLDGAVLQVGQELMVPAG